MAHRHHEIGGPEVLRIEEIEVPRDLHAPLGAGYT